MTGQSTKKGGISFYEYDTKYRLPEQERAVELLISRKRFILGWEPGKSKSYPVIDAVRRIEQKLGRPITLLVLSDAGTIKNMWRLEIDPQRIMPRDTFYCSDRTAIGDVSTHLLSAHWDVIIVDECQSLRSGITRNKSKFAKLVYSLTKKAEYVFGMSGTLSGNNNIEPWCVLHNLNVAGQGSTSTKAFKNRYCVLELKYGPFGNFMVPTKLNEHGEALMQQAYKGGVMFWGYDEDSEMPPMNIEYISFPVPETQDYKNALEGILKCGDHESTTLKAIALQKAQQTLNGFLYYNNEQEVRQTWLVNDYQNPKLKWIRDKFIQGGRRPLIVAYRYQEDLTQLQRAFGPIPTTTNIKQFKDNYQQFPVLLLQCSRGKAVNLQFCQDIVYYTSDFSFISFKQFIHRCWRRGQDKPCNVYFLSNDPGDKHKVEWKIWNALRNKQNIHDMLMSIKGG